MAIKNYQWRTRTEHASDTSLSWGVIPDDTSWHTSEPGSGSVTASYYYRDSNTPPWSDSISSRVIISVTNTWSASISIRNVLTITLQTVINSIKRDDVRGAESPTPGRNIDVYNSNGTRIFGTYTDNSVNTAHVISGPINVGTTTIVLPAGQDTAISALRLHNQSVGGSSYDDIGIGVQFRNILPTDYRPGATLDSNGVWQAHDRDDGKAHILTPMNSWREMRSSGGLVDCGNPPSIYLNNKWYNQREFGTE